MIFGNRFWFGLPPELDHVDAVYERVGDGQIIFRDKESANKFLDPDMEPEFLDHSQNLNDCFMSQRLSLPVIS